MFRSEARAYRSERLHGDLSLAVPPGWHIVGLLLLGAITTGFAYLATASYTRGETVAGTILIDGGAATVTAMRPGVITAIYPKENQIVRAGTPLVRVAADEMTDAGRPASDEVLETMTVQERLIISQSGSAAEATAAERARLATVRQGLAAEVNGLEQQIEAQRGLVAKAAAELELVDEVAKRGFLSRRDILTREESLITRRQQLTQLEQTRAVKIAALAQVGQEQEAASARGAAETARLDSARAEIEERRRGLENSRSYVLTAPLDGRASAIDVRPGEAVAAGTPVMEIVPLRGATQVRLLVPTRSIGFLAKGQTVRLAIDAYPYETFGTIAGNVASISATPIQPSAQPGPPAYLVLVTVQRPWITAFGKRHRLIAGMGVSARIVTRRQTLLEWLLEPLYAVRNR